VLPDVFVANPSFERDIQPIFTARCATASCHNLATQQLGLNLQAGYAYDEIVDEDSETSHDLELRRPVQAGQLLDRADHRHRSGAPVLRRSHAARPGAAHRQPDRDTHQLGQRGAPRN